MAKDLSFKRLVDEATQTNISINWDKALEDRNRIVYAGEYPTPEIKFYPMEEKKIVYSKKATEVVIEFDRKDPKQVARAVKDMEKLYNDGYVVRNCSSTVADYNIVVGAEKTTYAFVYSNY